MQPASISVSKQRRTGCHDDIKFHDVNNLTLLTTIGVYGLLLYAGAQSLQLTHGPQAANQSHE
jgi:hypothetical protein